MWFLGIGIAMRQQQPLSQLTGTPGTAMPGSHDRWKGTRAAHREAKLEGCCHRVGGLKAAAHPVGGDPSASQRQRGIAPQLRVEDVSGAHKVGELEALPALQGESSLYGHHFMLTMLEASWQKQLCLHRL